MRLSPPVCRARIGAPTSDVMIPGVEPVPDYVFSHFLK